MWHPEFTFPEWLKTASLKDRCEYFSKGFHLEHSLLEVSKQRVSSTLFKADQYQIVNLVGPTGVGKTELARDVVKSVFLRSARELKSNFGLPAVYTEIPVYGGSVFDWKDLYLRVLDGMNGPPENLCRSIKWPVNPNSGRGYSEKHRKEGEIRKALENRIRELNVRVLIFDEVQHLFKFTAKNAEKSLDILKSLANITQCQIVLIGTYESLRGISWSGQLSRRTENIHFHRYDWAVAEQRNGFASAFAGLLAHIPFEISKELSTQEALFECYQMCCGCIGILKQNIEKTLANKTDDSVVKLEHLRSASLSTNERIQIAREIREGEEFFTEDDVDELNTLLGIQKPTAANRSKSGSKNKGRVGVRKPKRDPIGEHA